MFRERVLDILEANVNTYVSTKVLVEALQRDRNQIWKAIERLRDEGYAIVSRPKKGYRLTLEQGISEKRLIELLKEEFQVIYFDSMSSSNDYAKETVFSQEKVIIVANEQVQARGQRDKTFYTEKNKGLYFTLVYHEEIDSLKMNEIPLLTSMALQKVLHNNLDRDCEIKWVNDLYYQNRKVAGILCESMVDHSSTKITKWIIGIGINLGDIEFSKHLHSLATSLKCEYDATKLLHLLVLEIDQMIRKSFCQYIVEYEQKSSVIGKQVKIDKSTHEYEGYVLGISKEGFLIIELANKQKEYLKSGSIRVI